MSKPVRLGSIDQFAVVVRDLDAAMARYVKDLGIGPWSVFTYGPHRLWRMTYRGVEQPYAMKLALAVVGASTHELIQPLDQGANIYQEFLDDRGEGLHHFGYYVPNIDEAIADMDAQGFPLLQSGRGFGVDLDGAYAYFDTEGAFGCIVEAIAQPRQLPDPEYIYPSGSA